MKLYALAGPQPARHRARGFTLTEMMISCTVFMLVVGAVVYSHMMGVRLYQITKSKLGASDEARTALGLLVSEIRGSRAVKIGSYDGSAFLETADGAAQSGNAAKVYLANYDALTNSGGTVIYYRDADTKELLRETGAALEVVAQNISNSVVFASTDYKGAVLTDNDNNRVINLNLEFYQIQYPLTRIGKGNYYEYYRLSTKITRRATSNPTP